MPTALRLLISSELIVAVDQHQLPAPIAAAAAADQHFPSACAAALARPVLISQELGDAPGQVGGASQWPDQYHQHVGAVVDSIRPRWHTKQLELIKATIAERAADPPSHQ